MDKVRMISTPAAVGAYLADLRSRGVKELALDLEADQGSYRYRYSICIFQCCDGREPVVIDVLALGGDLEELKELLEAPDIVKVMFSCKNDLFITQNVMDCGIEPISDIAAAQKALGLKVSLADKLELSKTEKDRFQRANWLVRPLSRALLEYAAGDVVHLLGMNAELRDSLARKKLLSQFEATCAALPRTDYRVDQYRQYENKFPEYRRLKPEQKESARLVWLFRELVGEHYDCPVGYILSTKVLPDLVAGLAPGSASLEDRLETALNKGRRAEKRIGRAFIAEKLAEAKRAIAENRSAGSPGIRKS